MLWTMKEITEERLLLEAYHATPLIYNANEVLMAIENVTRVKASTNIEEKEGVKVDSWDNLTIINWIGKEKVC